MSLVSLKTSLDHAIAHDIKPYATYMEKLGGDIAEIASTLKAAYARQGSKVEIFNTARSDSATLTYILEKTPSLLETDRQYEDLYHSVGWSAFINDQTEKFEFVCSDSDSNMDDDPVSFSISDTGYQSLVALFTETLIKFLPLDIKIACFEENARKTGQKTLDF